MNRSIFSSPCRYGRWLATLACVAAVAGQVAQAHAQAAGPPSLVNINYEYYAETDDTTEGNDGRYQLDLFRIRGGFPIELSPVTLVLPLLTYSVLQISPRDIPPEQSNALNEGDLNLHSGLLNTFVIHQLSKSWTTIAGLGVGIASDLAGDLDSDDLVVTATLLFTYALRSDFTLGFGVGYDRRTGELRPLPNFSVNWQPHPDFAIRGLVPAYLEVAYRVNDRLAVSALGGLDGNQYHLDEGRIGGVEDVDVAYSTIRTCPALTANARKVIHLRASVCAVFARRLELFLDQESIGDGSMGDGWSFGFELWLGPDPWAPPDAD
ncbi:MAG: DUF6268 family outer membrane beta-barrel protein [Myxococcota bacterium]